VHLKISVANKTVKYFVVVTLNTRKVVIPSTWILVDVDSYDMYNHPIEYLCMFINMGMEVDFVSSLFVVRCRPNSRPKDT
jgi:hypothetical protein